MNGNTLLNGQPSDRLDPEPNDKWIAVGKKQRCFVDVRPLYDLENTDPPRKLRHIADQPVATLDPTSDTPVTKAETGHCPIGAAEGLIRLWEKRSRKYAMFLLRAGPANGLRVSGRRSRTLAQTWPLHRRSPPRACSAAR